VGTVKATRGSSAVGRWADTLAATSVSDFILSIGPISGRRFATERPGGAVRRRRVTPDAFTKRAQGRSHLFTVAAVEPQFLEIQSAICGNKAIVANLDTSGTSLARS